MKRPQSITTAYERLNRRRLASGSRVGWHARRQIHARQLEWFRKTWPAVSALIAIAAILAVAAQVLLPSWLGAYFGGALLASGFWMVYVVMIESTRIASLKAGVEAELWTASELRGLTNKGWQLVNHVMAENEDIDHALFGPGGFFAVETKYRSDWSSEYVRLDRFSGQARRGAWLLQSRSQVKQPAVQPLVVAWGPDVLDALPKATAHASVTICPGPLLRSYLESLPVTVQADQVGRAAEAVRQYVATRDKGELSKHGEIPRGLSGAVDSLLAVCLAGLLGALLVLLPIQRTPYGLGSVGVAIALSWVGWKVWRRPSFALRWRRVGLALLTMSAGLGSLWLIALCVVLL